MSLPRAALLFALVAWATPAAAQSVMIEFNDGRVTVHANDVQVRTILSEWARIGGTTIVNGDQVTGAPVTLELTDVPERKALDIILRDVSGYMAGPRPADGSGPSAYDRIMILPTSAPVRASAPAPVFSPPQPEPYPIPEFDPNDPEEEPVTDIPPDAQDDPPGPRPRRGFRFTQPFPPAQPDPDVDPAEEVPSVGTNPFGVRPGSTRPGVISPVPEDDDPVETPDDDREP